MRARLRTGLVALTAVLTAAAWAPGAVAAPATAGSGTDPSSATVVGPHLYRVTADIDGRTARNLANHAVVDQYPEGSSVLVVCQSTGDVAYGGSRIWDLTSDGLWVPDELVPTGTSGSYAPDLPRCTIPQTYVAARTLDGRTARVLSNHARPDRYPRGSRVQITCQALGGPTYHGSSLWDRTVDGLWIPDHFLRTGTAGWVTGLPRCEAGDTVTPAPAPAADSPARAGQDRQLSVQGASFIAAYEGYRSTAYDDAGGHCTIGYGHLVHLGGCSRADAARWGSLTQDEALALLWQDAQTYAAGVRAALPRTPLSQAQFDALVSLSYNIGNGGFRGSAVRASLAGSTPDHAAVPDLMLRWVSSSGVELPGLRRRRLNEGRLFSTGSYAIIPARPYSLS
ncbi:Phage-related lysozyme (muramidase), GH24 family [Friedmanniella luteola]|uniref:Lysozyme n=1 Tax=Friedmanniella luteola TaxID=546871 RepID=A0A1H1WLZ3_9ACTN|nr:lysozyme [Friedmanniella luteola]SDS97159.1 Phage-related lysozyme (muramidase), GH24 family [Friedmanniella luteola]